MAKVRMNGTEYDVPDSSDWTAGELAEAEQAIGAMFGGKSKGIDIAITTYIAIRRVDKETHMAQLGDIAKNVRFSDLVLEEDETPLGAEGLEGLPISGHRLSAVSE